MSKKNKMKNVPEIVEKPVEQMTRTEKKEKTLRKELHVEETSTHVLNDTDRTNIQRQCERLDRAKVLGTINSAFARYTVYYRDQWLFVVYNRDSHRLIDFINFSSLTQSEKNSFQIFKNQIDLKRRMRNAPQSNSIVRPIVMVKQVPPPTTLTPMDDEEDNL